MAATLRPWLHREVKDQLDLGHNWLAAKNKAKAESSRPAAHVDSRWDRLYHDNGSCIDIIVPFHTAHAHVLVSKTNPLTITDGLHSTATSLSPACLASLRARQSSRNITAGAAWTVKKYTLRYTSYGPPRNKLRLILDAVDWVDIRQDNVLANAEALNRSNEIASTLQLIHDARVQDDDRCLRSQPKGEETTNDGYTMAGADEPRDDGASMDTQMPFGTQPHHPIRAQRSEDEVSFMGINRMEPVLGGNTQRAELKPRSGSASNDRRKQAQLLSLLAQRGLQPASPQSPARHHARSTPEPRRFGDTVSTASPHPRETPSKRANRERIEELLAQASQAPQENGSKRMQESGTGSPDHSVQKTYLSEDGLKRSNVSEDTSATECSWMKGLTLNRATATVPDDQSYLLNKPESWAKQPKFPPTNVPTSLFLIFSRITDEKAALEGATSSGSFHEPPSSGSYPANSAPQPTDEQDDDSEDEAPTSPVSWKTSPSPEPPQPPTRPQQGLPPDSSLEMPEDIAAAVNPRGPTVRCEQRLSSGSPASSHDKEEEFPPSSPPAQLAALDSDDDMDLEISVPTALGGELPPPTKSVVQVKETPYVKSKNGQQPAVTICPPTQESASHSSSASIVRGTYQELSSSVVEETRLDSLGKGSEGHQSKANVDLWAEVQDAQIVPGDVLQYMPIVDKSVHEAALTGMVPRGDSEKQARSLQTELTDAIQPEPTPMSAQLPPKDSSSGEQPATTPAEAAMRVPSQPEKRPSKDTPSLVKRKPEASPTQDRRRGSKVKRPRYAFGGRNPEVMIRERREAERRKSTTSAESRQGSVSTVPVQQDPDTEMKDPGAEEVVKAQVEEAVKAQVEEAVKAQVDEAVQVQVEEANAIAAGAMSPRHQSLYATPSPVWRPVVAPPAADAAIPSIDLDQSRQNQQVSPANQTTDQAISAEHAAVQQTEERQEFETLPEPQSKPQEKPAATSAPDSVLMPRLVPKPQPLPSHMSPASREVPTSTVQVSFDVSSDSSAPLTVFEKFRAAYPEYNASSKHFANQCKLIEELDREDRMVPKWMWDDFIIRNRTDYAQYAADCIESGEEPMKYIRFYKDTIRDAIFRKGVVETTVVLEKALQELGVQLPVIRAAEPQTHIIEPSPRLPSLRQTHSPMPPPPQPVISSLKRKPSRRSLPFTVPSSVSSGHVNTTAQIRHSLPASSSHATPASTPASSRPASSAHRPPRSSLGNTLRRFKSELSASPLETGTGNEYRDFIKAQEALTATTGSTSIDKSKAWPRSLEVRPSVRDLPRKKIDVLEWGDVL